MEDLQQQSVYVKRPLVIEGQEVPGKKRKNKKDQKVSSITQAPPHSDSLSEPYPSHPNIPTHNVNVHLINYINKLENILLRTRDKLRNERKIFANVISSLSNYLDNQNVSAKSIEDYIQSLNQRQIDISPESSDKPLDLYNTFYRQYSLYSQQQLQPQVISKNTGRPTNNVIKIVINDQIDENKPYRKNGKGRRKLEDCKDEQHKKHKHNNSDFNTNGVEKQSYKNSKLQQQQLHLQQQQYQQSLQQLAIEPQNEFVKQQENEFSKSQQDALLNYYNTLQENTQKLISQTENSDQLSFNKNFLEQLQIQQGENSQQQYDQF